MKEMEIKELKKENLELNAMLKVYKKKLHIVMQALNALEDCPDRRVASRCKEHLASQGL